MLNKNKGNAAKHNCVNLYKVGLTALGVALDLKTALVPAGKNTPGRGRLTSEAQINGGIRCLT